MRAAAAGVRLVAVGLDHTTAPIDLRERVAFADSAVPAALARLTDPDDRVLEQAAIVSTCKPRRGLRHHAIAGFAGGADVILASYHGLDSSELTGSVYVHRGAEVAHHLAATSAGLHSLVLGEAQIQGQVRRALEHAIAAGTAGPELRRMFESAISSPRCC